FHPDEDLGAAPERRTVKMLAADGPIEHVTQQLKRPVDRRRREPAVVQAIDRARLLHVGDEVFDVRRPDVCDRTIAETLDQRLEPVVDRAGDGQTLREDVPLFVDFSKLAERQRRRIRERLEAALVEGSGADRFPQVVEDRVSLRLRANLAVRPPGEADAPTPEATPPPMPASIASASLVLTDLVKTHGSSFLLLVTRHRRAPSPARRRARLLRLANAVPATRQSIPL